MNPIWAFVTQCHPFASGYFLHHSSPITMFGVNEKETIKIIFKAYIVLSTS